MSRRLFILLPLCCMLCACSGVKEARQTVAVADSLRVNHGVAYANGAPANNVQRGVGDSLALAEAYATLGHWSLIYPDDYARACYYYGRLLRSRNDQVSAMRAFIAGTHVSHIGFHDHHILARIYSNMGTMCHLAGEFELSYEMYDLSAQQFKDAGDTTLHYYQLNAMAYQLAEQNLHDETLTLLGKIETECTDTNVLTKTWETKAELYRNLALYDSAIFAAHQLYAYGYQATSGYVTMAQAFWHLEQHDSAVYYAKRVIDNPYAVEQDLYNMLYLVAYCDTTISQDDKLRHSEEREDVDKEFLDPLHIQLAQAIEVLTQDRNKKPHYINIGLLLLSLCIVGGVTWIAVACIKRHRKQSLEAIEAKQFELQQNITEQRQELYAETERERQIQQDLRMQQKELEKQNTHILADIEQLQDSNGALRQENADLSALHSERRAELVKQIENNCYAIRNSDNWKDILYWNKHDLLCEAADKHLNLLATKLQVLNVLNEKEIHLCILVVIGDFSDKQLAALLNYGEKSIRGIKLRTAKKLGTTSARFREYLMQLVIN